MMPRSLRISAAGGSGSAAAETAPVRRCPLCERSLARLRVAGRQVDVCRPCVGVWFDHGELTEYLLAQRRAKSSLEEELGPDPAAPGVDARSELQCPVCRGRPLLMPFDVRPGRLMGLPRCPACKGFWVSRRALTCIAKGQRPPFYGTPRRQVDTSAAVFRGLAWLFGIGQEQERAKLPWHAYAQMLVGPYDDNPTARWPVATAGLIVVNVAVMAVVMISGASPDALYAAWGLTPSEPWAPHRMITLFTSQFLHGGVFHLFGNMVYLYMAGDNVEERLGSAFYLVAYLGCGIVAGLLDGLVRAGSTIPAVGASGAISGVLGMYIIFFPQARLYILTRVGVRSLPAWAVLGMWVLVQMIGMAGQREVGVAFGAHVGGFVAGVGLALVSGAGGGDASEVVAGSARLAGREGMGRQRSGRAGASRAGGRRRSAP